MSTLLQISDPHFGTEQPHVVHALRRLARSLRPELIVFSGDITQRARRTQFTAARRFAAGLGAPVLAVPGNHDIPLFNIVARIVSPYGNYMSAFGGNLEPEYDSDTFLVVCTNTTRPARHKDGEISCAQIARVCARLRQATPEQVRIVVTHQPVLAIRKEDEANLLHGHETAVRVWSHAGADIIMSGHIHLPYVRSLAERFSDLPRRTWCVQAGTAVSWRIRGDVPNSINVLRHARGDPACRVERWDFDATRKEFHCVSKNLLVLDRMH